MPKKVTSNIGNVVDAYTPEAILESVIRDSGKKDYTIDDVSATMDMVKEVIHTGRAYTQDGKCTFSDVLSTPDLTRFVEASLVDIMREPIMPNMVVIPNLFSIIQLNGPIPSIRINQIGPVRIHEMAEGSDYKESGFDIDDTSQRIDIPIKKYGGIVRVTDEALELGLIDFIRMWFQRMGVSFAQHREKTAMQMLNRFGTVVFDNVNPSASVNGSYTGRGIDGVANGTMTVHDIFDMYAHLALRGFNPDTLIMNPMAWQLFMTDPETREIIVNNAVLSTRRMPNGSYAPGWGSTFGGFGERLTATGNPNIDPTTGEKLGISAYGASFARNHELSMLGSTFNIPPGTAGLPSPLKVIVTPYAGYRQDGTGNNWLTDIFMVDSSAVGVMVQKELPSLSEFEDPWKDIKVAKCKERYGFGILEQGKAIAVAKNIVIGRNYVFDNVNSVTLSELDTSAVRATL